MLTYRLGIKGYPFAVDNGGYQGSAEIASFAPEEMFGTKLRALLQRNKNRDLFDLFHGLEQLALDPGRFLFLLRVSGKIGLRTIRYRNSAG